MERLPQDLLDAAWAKLDEGDSVGAARLASEIASESDLDPVRGEALLITAHVLVLNGEREKGATTLAAARPLLPDDAEILTDAANVALALADADAAAALASHALKLNDQLADAAYAGALAADALGKADIALELAQLTAELDASDPDPPWAMTVDDFAAIAEATLAELPFEITSRLENVPIIVEPAPSTELIAEGIDPRLLGLFSGLSLTERSSIEPGPPSLDAIHLFQRNLERHCADREELESEIRVTVLHETAHFFGLEDDDLEAIGLG